MERKDPSTETDKENALKIVSPMQLNNRKPRVTAVSCTSFPESVSRIVGDYLPDSESEYVVAALVGVQTMTICLAQDVDSPLGNCWSLGFLPSDRQWDSWHVEVDKQFPIKNIDECLGFLNEKGPNYCRIVIEVLVVKLSMTSSDSPSALDDLRNSIGVLQGHFGSVKHVIFSITEYSYCCFTLKNAPDKETGVSPPVDHQLILLQVIDDLETCWKANGRLTTEELIVFYFKGSTKPASEMYLAKFVVSLAHPPGQALFRQEASRMVSNKIMWISSLKLEADLHPVDQNTTRFCHAMNLNETGIRAGQNAKFGDWVQNTLCFYDNPYVERIVIKCPPYPFTVKLPRPSAPLADTTRLSALVELTLINNGIILHLAHLNNGYFPRLAHLTLIGETIVGHLDSDRVPCLETLRLEPMFFSRQDIADFYPLVQKRTQSLIDTGRPWQLVATKKWGGWSLASYDEPATNPQDEVKEDAVRPHSLPLIRELLIVMDDQIHADEWQSQLEGSPSVEAAAENHSDRLLVCAPQCVEKLTVFCTSERSVHLEFEESIPEQTRILTSFMSFNVIVALDGAALPNLQLLELTSGKVTMSGAFPNLQLLSFKKVEVQSPWQLDAPLLQSFSCRNVRSGQYLSLDVQSLSHLSFLQIMPLEGNSACSPQLFDSKHNQARLDFEPNQVPLQAKHVVLGNGMLFAPFFQRFLVDSVLHLELTVCTSQLPVSWHNDVWPCEVLTLSVTTHNPDFYQQLKTPKMVVLPRLPRLKALTVISQGYPVLLNRDMPELLDCTIPSPKSLGPNLKCPKLRRIRFTDQLTDGDKKKCLDTATYVAVGARPKEIFFDSDGEGHTIHWQLPLDKPVEADGFLVIFAKVALFFIFSFFYVFSANT